MGGCNFSMAYSRVMRNEAVVALACATLIGCSSPEPAKKEAAAVAKNEKAPEGFKVNLDTSKGPVTIEAHRDWAPIGADHFYSLVQTGFYNDARFFRWCGISWCSSG